MFRYSSNQFWEKFNFAKAAMKSEMCSIIVVSPLVSVTWDQVEQLIIRQLGFSAAAIGLSKYEEDEKAAREGKCEIVFSSPETWLSSLENGIARW